MSLLTRFLVLTFLVSTITIGFLSSPNPVYACDVSVDKDRYTPGERVTLTVTGAKPNQIVNLVLRKYDANINSSVEVTTVEAQANSTGFADTSFEAPLVFANYNLSIVDIAADCTSSGPSDLTLFTVGSAGSGSITFDTSPAVVTSTDKSITITILGLDPDGCYVIEKVAGFDGDRVEQHDSDSLCVSGSSLIPDIFLKPDEDGDLRISKICTNMEGPRRDCEDPFVANRTYKFQVKRVSGLNSFGVPDEFELVGGVLSFTVLETDLPPTAGDTGQLSDRVRELVNFLLRFGVGIAGGVAFLLLVYGSLKLIFSAGNPESVMQAREVITAAVIGLLVVIFSVFLLRLIGISILGLPI